jgi:hypothetical protein
MAQGILEGNTDTIGWAPVVRGVFRAGKAEKALVLTCCICARSQLYLDRSEDHEQIKKYWELGPSGWRHKRCYG